MKNKTKIRKAVFPVAGLGTRFLPATKAMPKELLPILDKPLIQYAVEEAIEAGIETLIFITGKNKRAIEDHFDSNHEMEMLLVSKGLKEKAEILQNIIPKHVQCIFVRQHQQLGLGHAILCAERVVGEDPFAVLLADDFLINNETSVVKNLIKGYNSSGKNQLSVMEVNGPDISKYGVVKPGTEPGLVSGLVEKPKFGEAPSNVASIGRYILTPDVFNILHSQSKGLDGEIQLADTINVLASMGCVEAIKLNGMRFDCGSMHGYIDAIFHEAKRVGIKV